MDIKNTEYWKEKINGLRAFPRTGFETLVKTENNLEVESGSGEEIGQEVKLVFLHGPRFDHRTKPRCEIYRL